MYLKFIILVYYHICSWTVQAQNDAFLVTKANTSEAICVLTGYATGSAIAWTNSANSTFQKDPSPEYRPQRQKIEFDCSFQDFKCVGRWTSRFWKQENSFKYPFAPRIDSGWNDFEVLYTKRRDFGEIPKQNKFYLQIDEGDELSISISVKVASNAHVMFCDGYYFLGSRCYMVILSGFENNSQSVIRKCVQGMPEEFAMEKSCQQLRASFVHDRPSVDDRRWTHFTFVLKKTYYTLELKVLAKDPEDLEYRPILQYIDEYQPIQIIYWGVRTYTENGQWKIHDYKFLRTTTATSRGILYTISQKVNLNNKNNLCLKMAIAQCVRCSFQLHVLNGRNIGADSQVVYGSEEDSNGLTHWQEETFVIPLTDVKKFKQLKLHYTTSTSPEPELEEEMFWMIAYVRECEPDETKILEYDHQYRGVDDVCQVLDDTSIRDKRNNARVMSAAMEKPPDCSIWYNRWRTCYGIRKSNANGGQGECYPGYNGPYCEDYTILVTDLEIVNKDYNNFVVKPKTLNSTGTIADYMTIQYQYLDRNRNWHNIGEVLPISNYLDDFKIPREIAWDSLFTGQISIRVLLYVEKGIAFDTPISGPVRPSCAELKGLTFSSTENSITITTESEVQSNKCPLQYYLLNISYPRAVISSDSKEGKAYILIRNLEPFSEYVIYFNGRQGEKIEHKFNTTDAAPGPVIEFAAYSAESDSISLRWKPPKPAKGILQYYDITYYIGNIEKRIKVSPQESRCSIWEKFTCTTIDGLTKGQGYNIWIRAYNRNPKPGQSDQLNARAEQGIPIEPGGLQQKNKNTTEITWRHPWVPNGKIEYFKIGWLFKSTHLRNKPSTTMHSLTMPVTKEMKEYSYTLIELSPASIYTIRVTAHNKNVGTPVEVDIVTPLVAPYIEGELQVRKIANNRMQISVPGSNNNVTEQSGFFIVVSEMDTKVFINKKKDIQTQHKRNYPEIWKEAQITENTETISWIAKYIDHLPQDDIEILIGSNDNMITNVWDGPLSDESTYSIAVVYYNELDGQRTYTTLFNNKIIDIENNYALWSLLLLLPIPVIVYLFVKGNLKQKNEKIDTISCNSSEGDHQESLVLANRATMKHYGSKISLVKPFARSQSQMTHCVDLSNFENYVRESLFNGELEKQHMMFKRGLLRNVTYGKQKENKNKNRYINLIAYDSTRVVLEKVPGDPCSDYINANYIDGYDRPREYIATQGPKKNTTNDFWRMVWQEKVTVICMLTNTKEGSKDKCHQYWPLIEGAQEQYGDITVRHVSSMVYADFVYRTLNISLGATNYIIEHLHFTSWPDHGVPQYAESVVTFINKFRSVQSDLGPKLIHCSAGVGRTGTIILADICLKMAHDFGKIDVLFHQSKIREQRANLVDNKDQYKLVHMILVESIFGEATNIPCSELRSKVNEMRVNNTLLEKWRNLDKHSWKDDFNQKSEKEPVIVNKRKEDRNNIVPGARNRVFISRFPLSDQDSDYINAVYVDGFRAKDQFIVTQFPLPHTIADYWRMISDKDITLVTMLNEIDTTDKTVQRFIPNETETVISPIPEISVHYQKAQETECCIITKVLLHDKTKSDEEISRNITVVQLKNWKSNQLLPGWDSKKAECLLTLWEQLEKLISGPEPVLMTCYDGATGCGLFTALTFVIEKIKLEHECDVPLAVRTVRRHRKEMIRSEEQCDFLYDAAIRFLDDFDTYANFQRKG